MAYKSKTDLKDVFSGLSSLYIKKGGFTIATSGGSVTWDYDMPVTVDSLNFTLAAPTLNHVKVHGLNADWAVTSTPGDCTFEATVPSVDDELLDYFTGGKTAVTGFTTTTEASTTVTWGGNAFEMKSPKLVVGIGLLNDSGDKLFLSGNLSIYATPLFENASTTPFAFKLTGSIEASDSSDKNTAFLTKTA